MPVQNAKISLLDPSNRDVLSADIYTDESETYEAAVEEDEDYQKIEWTIVSDNEITFTIYDSRPTLDEAMNDMVPLIENVTCTRSAGGS